MKQKTLLEMLQTVVYELRENKQWGTAHVYQSTYNSFTLYNNGKDVALADLTPALLKDYELFLRDRQCTWNTVATYMKVIKATYNRAVDRGYVTLVPRLFKQVTTGVFAERKKALAEEEMADLMNCAEKQADNSPMPPSCRQALDYFLLMFLLCGIPFVDLAYLRKTDLQGDRLRYRRRKTGRQLIVRLTPEARALLVQLADKRKHSPYLFPFLASPEGTEAAYHEYQCALRRFNHRLAALAALRKESRPLTTYVARHTWATMAYYCEVHPGIISEAMGHSSIAITETYLKPFRSEKIDEANRRVIAYVRNFFVQSCPPPLPAK